MTSSDHLWRINTRMFLVSMVTLVAMMLQCVEVSCQTNGTAAAAAFVPPSPPPRLTCVPEDVLTRGIQCDDLPDIVCPNTTRKLDDSDFKEVVMLASYPGSGNTWARYLVEISTGLMTGSMYCDDELAKVFAGECKKDNPDAYVVYKTHYPYFPTFNFFGFFSNDLPFGKQVPKAILVVRNPMDALVAEYTRTISKEHTKEVPLEAFLKPQWEEYINRMVLRWATFHRYWLDEFEGEILYVLFDDLRDHTHREIQRILHFLGRGFTYSNCHYSDSEGKFRRKKQSDFVPYTKKQALTVSRVTKNPFERIKDRRSKQA